MELTAIFQIGGFFITIILCIVAICTYKRNKRIDLENQLFLNKMRALSKLSAEFDRFFKLMEKKYIYLKLLKDNMDDNLSVKLEALADEIELKIESCSNLIIENMVFMSDQTRELFLKLNDNFYSEPNEENVQDFSRSIELINQHIEVQMSLANVAIEKLYSEMGIEKLNGRLYKRLKK